MMTERKSVMENFGGTRGVIALVIGFVVATGSYRWQTVSSGYAMRDVGEELGLLGEIGGQLEIAVLSSVKDEYEEAAKPAITAIQQRR